jgi:hypothetical protein
MSKKLKVYYHCEGGKLKPFPYQREILDGYVASLEDGTSIEITLSKQKSEKSPEQLGYYYAVILPAAVEGFINLGHDAIPIASLYGENDEIKTTTKSMDTYLKNRYRDYLGEKESPLKRNMTVEECSDFICFVLKWLIEKPGIYCPPPRSK